MREVGILQSTLAITLPATAMKPEAKPGGGTFSLISQARAGDMAAFDQLMGQHERLVLMTALRFLNGKRRGCSGCGADRVYSAASLARPVP
jgi:hypothetical protein